MCREYGKGIWEEMIGAYLIMARRQAVFHCIHFQLRFGFSYFGYLMCTTVHPVGPFSIS